MGTASNRSGFGTRITVKASGHTWIGELGACSYIASNSPFLQFGLGTRSTVDLLTVRFPSGTTVSRTAVPAGQILTIHEDDASPVRLLAFDVAGVAEGARVHWTYVDDGDLNAFALSRIRGGEETLLAPALRTRGGDGEYLDRDAPPGVPVTYALDALYRDGGRERVGTVSFRLEPGTAPGLGQNFPNPFTASTLIPVGASAGATPVVRIFDAAGRLVRTLSGPVSGSGSMRWDGADDGGRAVPTGIYFYRVAGTGRTLKMIRRP